MIQNHREIPDFIYHPCNGVVSHGAQFGGLQVFADHTRKSKGTTNVFMNFARFMYVCLHTQTYVHAGCTHSWKTMIILIMGKTRRLPIWAPCRDQDGTGSGISGVQNWLWFFGELSLNTSHRLLTIKDLALSQILILYAFFFQISAAWTCKLLASQFTLYFSLFSHQIWNTTLSQWPASSQRT